jgi:hypothetical protein
MNQVPGETVTVSHCSLYMNQVPGETVTISHCSLYMNQVPEETVTVSHCSLYMNQVPGETVTISHYSLYMNQVPGETVTVSHCSLYMNQVPGDCYLYSRRIKQKFIFILYFYCSANEMIEGLKEFLMFFFYKTNLNLNRFEIYWTISFYLHVHVYFYLL